MSAVYPNTRVVGEKADTRFELGETSFGGQRYDTWRINGFYNSATALDKSNFANVTFEASLRYESNGSTVVTRPLTLSVYKRD